MLIKYAQMFPDLLSPIKSQDQAVARKGKKTPENLQLLEKRGLAGTTSDNQFQVGDFGRVL